MLKSSLPRQSAEWVFHASGLLCLAAVALLAWQSNQDAPMSLALFWTLCVVAFALSLTAGWGVARSKGGIALWHILAWCVALRIVGVSGSPIYEDDYYRYLWDGRQTIEHGTPYASAPADAFATEEDPVWEAVLDNVNNPELPTIYGPVNQYVFALAYLIGPADVKVLQVILAAADLAIVVLLSRLAALPPLVLYGFSPLILKEFSFTAHPDVLSALGLVAATVLWRSGRLHWAAAALAVAVSAKLFALLLVPLLLRWHWRAWLVFILGTALLHLPLADSSGMGQALSTMAGSWLFNAPVYYLLHRHVDVQVIKALLVLMFAALCAGYFFTARYHRSRPPRVPRADALYFAMLVAIPAFNPWYYVFVLVFAVVHPTAWAWTGSLSILCAYATGLQLGTGELELYQQPAWSLVAGFLPVAIAAAIPALMSRYSRSA